MSQAVFGLVGVVIGGVLTGTVQLFLERRREAAVERAARRLVTDELLNQWLQMGIVIGHGRTPDKQSDEFMAGFLSTEEWERHRDELARTLPESEWTILARQMAIAALVRMGVKALPPSTPIPKTLNVVGFRRRTADAYRALVGHGPEEMLGKV